MFSLRLTDRPEAAIGKAIGDLLAKTLVGSGSVEVDDVLLNNKVELLVVAVQDHIDTSSRCVVIESKADLVQLLQGSPFSPMG